MAQVFVLAWVFLASLSCWVAADSPAIIVNTLPIKNGELLDVLPEATTVLDSNELSTEIALVQANSTDGNSTLHDHINHLLADDEERVMSGGEVKIRKKRTFCKRCYPTQSYGYGGGGGCCGQCGQCGGGGRSYARPIKVIKVIVKPSYGYGGGGGCCRSSCNVCGR